MAALAVTTTGAAQAAVPDNWGFAFVDKPMVAGIPDLSHQAGSWPPPLHVHSAPGAPGQVLNSTVNGENADAPSADRYFRAGTCAASNAAICNGQSNPADLIRAIRLAKFLFH